MWSDSGAIAERAAAAMTAKQTSAAQAAAVTNSLQFALGSVESHLAQAAANAPPTVPLLKPSGRFDMWSNPASIAEQAAKSQLQSATQRRRSSGTDESSLGWASAGVFLSAPRSAPFTQPPIAPFAPPPAALVAPPPTCAATTAPSALPSSEPTTSPPAPPPTSPSLLKLSDPKYAAEIALRSGIDSARNASDARAARANARSVDDGRSQTAILGMQLSNEREKLAAVVTDAATSMTSLQSQLAELRQAGMESAVREMSMRHANSELRESSDAWAREASEARASAIVDAYDRADSDALANEIFKSETQGIFACRSGVGGLLHDIAQARAGKTGNPKSPVTKAFFAKLAVKGGPALAQWAANVLGEGTSVVSEGQLHDTLKRYPNVAIGHDEAAIETNMTRAIEFYTDSGIHTDETDYGVCEDATAHGKHVEVKIHNGSVRAFGFSGGPYDIDSKTELLELLQKHGLSSTTYVHLLVPQTRKAPTFPIAMSGSNNKFDREQVHCQQMRILRAFKRVTGLNSIHEFNSDGDARCRRQYLMMQFNMLQHHLFMSIEHEMIRIRVPHIDGYGYVMFDQCDMHVAWRFAIQYLKLKVGSSPSHMRLGPLRYCPGDFQRAATSAKLPKGQRLTVAAFGVHDKQNEIGCRLKGGLNKAGGRLPDSENFLITLWNDKAEAHLRPDILYHMVLGRYISLHVDKSLTLEQRVESVGFVLEFLSLSYELAVETDGTSPKEHWLTRETATDMLVGLMLKILLLKYYREKGRKTPPTFERLASKMLEFFFQQIRSYDRNSSVFTFFQASRLLPLAISLPSHTPSFPTVRYFAGQEIYRQYSTRLRCESQLRRWASQGRLRKRSAG